MEHDSLPVLQTAFVGVYVQSGFCPRSTVYTDLSWENPLMLPKKNLDRYVLNIPASYSLIYELYHKQKLFKFLTIKVKINSSEK